MTVRTRFAPSPTGFMHVGNLRTALYAYLIARSGGGQFILRIEDTDRNRYVEGAVDVIYKTLAAAGLKHDEGPDCPGECGPYVQSERRGLYEQYAKELVAQGAAYYCFCGKSEAEESENGEEMPHDAADVCACRDLPLSEAEAKIAAGAPWVIRQKIDRTGSTTFHDLVFGDITIENKVLDDQILLKSDGLPTYNFANVVDDHLMKISHVVRGCEYLSSTPKYNLLYRAFGWEIPNYVHLPLIMGRNEDGSISKLSKRHGSVSFENLAAEGYLPEAIINYVALLGWSSKSDRELFTLKELEEAFRIDALNKAPAVFDYAKLGWMNGEYLKALDFEVFEKMARPFAQVEGTALEAAWPVIAKLMQSRVAKLSEIPGKIAFLLERPAFSTELFINKKNKSDLESAKKELEAVIPELEALPNWEHDALMALLEKRAAQSHVKSVMWAVRIALAGLAVTPGGAVEIMEILGRETSLARLKSALAMLAA